MTDRMKGAWVAFDRDIREDDVEHLVSAIGMLKGVAGVELEVATPDDWMARTRVRNDVAWTLQAVLHGILSDGPVFVHDRDKVVAQLEEVLERIKKKGRS